ncbi:hypothetical protein B0H17DRAFT_1193091 [Mycena rosella]|uniref:Uncharacterized protein n=1 Tax=Mycena rosella TaxID=1033263 RepID=A0AAD7M816_MYCRO|nr:hypothetical protein B0H17DRAFT_1193091 [Mycena rosella]
MSHALADRTTTTIPASPGCWANSEDAVKTCCNLFGGVRAPLPDSDIPGCAYNTGARFVADGGATSTNTTTARWTDCVATHFPQSDGSVVLSTCQDFQNQIARVTSTPSSTPSSTGTSGALPLRTRNGLGRVVFAGIVAGSALVHLLALAM